MNINNDYNRFIVDVVLYLWNVQLLLLHDGKHVVVVLFVVILVGLTNVIGPVKVDRRFPVSSSCSSTDVSTNSREP